MADYYALPYGAKAPDELNVVVEIPSGSRNKYEYDHELGLFRLDRVLHSAMYYPGEYGFVPQTLALDGDPLDVLVVGLAPTFCGCVVTARPIGVLPMVDNGDPDDKILAVAVGDPTYKHVTEHTQISPHVLAQIANFFGTYKMLEKKTVEIGAWQDVARAKTIVNESIARYAEGKA
jgi:inorganic pyrophosphatase